MDCLHLKGLRCYGYTGALPEEQVLGQWFQVDICLWLDLQPAAVSDALEDALDYRNIISQIQTLFQDHRFHLIERLASEIANLGLGFAQVQEVEVQLTKLTPPIPNFNGSITVQLRRSRCA